MRPGAEAQLNAEMDRFQARQVPGFVAEYIYRMDTDPNEVYMSVVFESKEAYHANANSPEMNEQFQRLMQLFDGEPEWHDGEIIYSTSQG
jgi:quinol monooxygenase YgiN